MSANSQASSKDDESNAVPDTTPSSSCKASVDADNPTVEQLSLSDETGVPEMLQSLEQSPKEKHVEGTIDKTIELGAGDLGSLNNPKAIAEICSNEKISLKDDNLETIKEEEILKGIVNPSTSVSHSESIENNGKNLKSIAKRTTEVAGYKETAIDDASDSDLELRWTDDDDDEDDQMDAHTSCDQALKQLDRELNIVDAETDINKVEGEKATSQDSDIMEKKLEYVESGTFKTDSYIQPLDKELLKPFDEVHGIDDDQKSANNSIDTAVAELQQLIDEDDDMVGTQPKSTEEETKPVVSSSTTVSINEDKDFESMDIDEPSDLDVTPTSSHTNKISPNVGFKEHDDIIPTADFTEPIKNEPSELDITPIASHTNKISLELGLKEHDMMTTPVADVIEPRIDDASEIGASAISLDIITKDPCIKPIAIADFTEPIKDGPSEIDITPTISNTDETSSDIKLKEHDVITTAVGDIAEPPEIDASAISLDIIIKEPDFVPIADFIEPIQVKASELDITLTSSHTKKLSIAIGLKEQDNMTTTVADTTEPTIDEASKMDASAISLDIVIKEPDVLTTTVAHITEPITTSKCEVDSRVSIEVDKGMGGNDNEEMTLNTPIQMDDISSEDAITSSIEVKDIDRNDSTEAAMVHADTVEIISKDNIFKESNDQRIDDSNTEIEINNDSFNPDYHINDIDTKDSLKSLSENIHDSKVSIECDDKSMDSNNVAELVPEIQPDNAKTKNKDSNDILTECEGEISMTDSKSSKENVDQNIDNTEFLSPQTDTLEIKTKDEGNVDNRIVVSGDIAEVTALQTAIEDVEVETKRDSEISQRSVDQDMEDNNRTGTVISKTQLDNISVRGAAGNNILKSSDQTVGCSLKETALKMQTDDVAVANITDVETLKGSDCHKMDGNINTDLVSNTQINKDDIPCADDNILNKSINQSMDDNDTAADLKIQHTSYATDTFNKSDNLIVADDDANKVIVGSKVQSDEIDIPSEDKVLLEIKEYAVDGSYNTDIISKLETSKGDMPSVTDGNLNKSDDLIMNDDADTDMGSKILTNKVDTACAAEDNISKDAKVHAMDACDNTKTVSITDRDEVDLPTVTDDKASKDSDENNMAESNTDIASKAHADKVDIPIADSQMSEDQPIEGDDTTNIVSKLKAGKVELVAETVSEIEMEVDTSSEKNDPILVGNDNIENVETTDDIPVQADVFITPDTTSDSIKINKVHRITRPDVMLDIPTQEFDFDDEFDDTNEKEAPLERMNDGASDMTSKTVTEIVKQLAKNVSPEKEAVLSKDSGKMQVSIDTTEAKLDCKSTESIDKTTAEKQEVSEKVIEEETAVIKKSSAEVADKVIEKEKSCDNETTPPKTGEKDPKTTEESTKTVEDDSKPSTSEAAKMTPDTLEEAQEVTDSLLAESSRVLDDDEEDDDEPEPDDDGDDGDDGDDDDDDFRPEDDNSNQTEESRHSEVDIQEEGIDIVFGNEADGIGLVSDSNEAEDELDATLLGDAADITVEENDPVAIVPTKIVTEAKDVQEKPEQKTVELDKVEQPIASEGKTTTTERRKSLLKDLLSMPNDEEPPSPTKSTNKLRKLDVTCARGIVNIVDLGESSSEDDKESKQDAPSVATTDKPDKGTVGMSKSVALKRPSTDCKTVALSAKDKEVDKDKAKDSEIFNLDSDEDDSPDGIKETGIPRENNQCINHNCVSMSSVPYYLADRVTVAYYGAARKRRRAVCQNCLDIVRSRNEGLLAGIKDFRPLMSLRMARPTQQLLEISDSDSEGEDDPIGEQGAKIIEDQLANLLNKSWYKYKLDGRLKETEEYLEAELEKMQKQSEEIDVLLKDCQKATDRLRVEFYSGFEPRRMELPAISLHDTPIASYTCLETEEDFSESSQLPMRYPKRRSSTAIETPAKKQAIPMGYTDNENKTVTRSSKEAAEAKQDEDKDISVVRLSAEAAPADLPPPGEMVRPPLRAGQQVYAMKNQYGAWLKGKVLETLVKTNDHQYTQCRIRFDHKVKNPCKTLSARSIAYTEPSEVRMTIGTRVIALFKNSENTNKRVSFYYSGVIAEIPNPVNGYRYLVFFDDGYAQYVPHAHTRLVCESSALVWEEVHPFSRDFVCNYLMKYPERPMVRMHQGQSLTVEWNGKWWDTKVIEVDAALVKVNFPDNRTEWIYRGSTRLQPLFAELQAARGGNRARLPRSTKANTKTNMPYVEYTRSEDQTTKADGLQSSEELRRQRSVAKKSTTASTLPQFAATDGVVSRVVFYTPKNSVRPYKMVPHTCGPQCNRKDLLSLKELRTYNPLTKPLLSGWERQIVRHKYSRTVMYRAPCGRRVRCVRELHGYLRAVRADMPVDLFDFSPNTHCLAEFVLNKTNVQKKDLSHGKENVPVPCVNYYDHSLPEFCSYNTERTPTAGVPLNLDPEFLCGCDCEDDCVDKRKCACWKMTLEGARTIGIESPNVGYEYRRLPEPLPSGIYECNSRCKCKSTCMNRVVQNPLQLKLQVFKTLNRGWGIRALNDVPKGAFLCIYAGNLLTDATANLDGLNEGDEYLAELDYIEVVESMKEGYEEDIPEADMKLDKKDSKRSESESESESTESEDEDKRGKSDDLDDDFQPGYLSHGIGTFNKRLRRREKKKSKEEVNAKPEEQPSEEKKKEEGDECITISDDEEVRESQREPSRFTAQEGMSDSKVVSKYRSIRTYFGKDEACYIMDAKVQGNIGRYLNHSCSPNVFVQNVFVDTHDPRFPWVSFFALHHIRAGTELTWNYNYDIGSVPGKVLYCFCGAPNCRGRLL